MRISIISQKDFFKYDFLFAIHVSQQVFAVKINQLKENVMKCFVIKIQYLVCILNAKRVVKSEDQEFQV